MDEKEYCKHGFCKGKKDCEHFLPMNGSMLCVFHDIGGNCQYKPICYPNCNFCFETTVCEYHQKDCPRWREIKAMDLVCDIFDCRNGCDE